MVGWKDFIYLESHDYEHLSEDLSFPISSKSSERKECNHGSQQWAAQPALSVAVSATQLLLRAQLSPQENEVNPSYSRVYEDFVRLSMQVLSRRCPSCLPSLSKLWLVASIIL